MNVDDGDPGNSPWVGIKVKITRKIEKEPSFSF